MGFSLFSSLTFYMLFVESFFTHCSEKHEGLGRAVSPCSMAVLSGRVLSGKRTRERRQSREKHFSLLPSQSPRSFTTPAVLCSRPAAWRLPHVKTPFVQVFPFERVNYAVELWRILKFYWESIFFFFPVVSALREVMKMVSDMLISCGQLFDHWCRV